MTARSKIFGLLTTSVVLLSGCSDTSSLSGGIVKSEASKNALPQSNRMSAGSDGDDAGLASSGNDTNDMTDDLGSGERLPPDVEERLKREREAGDDPESTDKITCVLRHTESDRSDVLPTAGKQRVALGDRSGKEGLGWGGSGRSKTVSGNASCEGLRSPGKGEGRRIVLCEIEGEKLRRCSLYAAGEVQAALSDEATSKFATDLGRIIASDQAQCEGFARRLNESKIQEPLIGCFPVFP